MATGSTRGCSARALRTCARPTAKAATSTWCRTPIPRFDEAKKLIYLDIDIDEGKQFYVSRIEFTGNTLTRDRVIRRELLIEEGQVYNSRLVDLSLLRLNQLSYFDTLKADQDVETQQNADAGTVDLLIKLHEKGKNSIGINGGISGLSGSFLGLNYQTNNFLGLGETLSVTANIGDLSRNLSFGFTEPYLRNKPISLGIQVFDRKTDFNPAKSYAITSGQSANLTNAQNSLLNNYNQSSKGVTVSTSEALRKLFRRSGVARVGLAYSLSQLWHHDVQPEHAERLPDPGLPRRASPAQNQFNGIVTSVVTPSFSFSTLDRSIGPHNGKDLSVAFQFAGVGGNTKYYAPSASWRQFFPMKGLEDQQGRPQRPRLSHPGSSTSPDSAARSLLPSPVSTAAARTICAASTSAPFRPTPSFPPRSMFNLTNPDGTRWSRAIPAIPRWDNVQIPLPIYRLASDRRRYHLSRRTWSTASRSSTRSPSRSSLTSA